MSRLLVFKELPLEMTRLDFGLRGEFTRGMMKVIEYPADMLVYGHPDFVSGRSVISFSSGFITYYHHNTCRLYVRTENPLDAMYGLIAERGDIKGMYTNLIRMLLAFNRDRTHNTLTEEDVFERLSI